MKRSLLILGIIVVLVVGFALAYLLLTPEEERDMAGGMGEMADAGGPNIPKVMGYSEGEEIRFVHTEASDAQVGQMLTEMMGGSPVLIVPELAQVPESARANVFVFTNGLEGHGPLGFQADIFDNPPSMEGYSPLRTLNRVTWQDDADARVLKSVEELRGAEANGELTIEQTGIVVNMPMVTWPGGER